MTSQEVIARSALRRVAWLRQEVDRDDVQAVPDLHRVYCRELAGLTASPRLKLQSITEG